MDFDELDPPRPSLEPKDLQTLSIKELEDYIHSLETEITRAEEMISSKQNLRSGAEGLFNVG